MNSFLRYVNECLGRNQYRYELYEWVFDFKNKKCIIVDRKYNNADYEVYRISYIDDNKPHWVFPAGLNKLQ